MSFCALHGMVPMMIVSADYLFRAVQDKVDALLFEPVARGAVRTCRTGRVGVRFVRKEHAKTGLRSGSVSHSAT